MEVPLKVAYVALFAPVYVEITLDRGRDIKLRSPSE